MPDRDRRLMRFLIGHLLVGTLPAAVFVGILFGTDALGLAALARADRDGSIAVALLAFGVWVTFGSLAMGAAVMALGRGTRTDDRHDAGSGHGPMRPIPVRVNPRCGSRSSR